LEATLKHDSGAVIAGTGDKREVRIRIQEVLNSYHFYDADHGGGIWIGKHYILVALTHHPKGDEYLVDFAKSVDDLMAGPRAK